jgi:hypothetical protein
LAEPKTVIEVGFTTTRVELQFKELWTMKKNVILTVAVVGLLSLVAADFAYAKG